MTGYQAAKAALMSTALFAAVFLAATITLRQDTPDRPPLVTPVWCEGTPYTGFCSLDLSDGREYVIYTDQITGQMAWYEQNWRQGT